MILQPVLAKHPSDYGYLEAGWSTNLLVDYLLQQGLEVSGSTVTSVLKRGGWVYKRFAKTMVSERALMLAVRTGQLTAWGLPPH